MSERVSLNDYELQIECQRDILLPAGWRRVWRGPVLQGDLFLHAGEAVYGRVRWLPATVPTAEESRQRAPYSEAQWYVCLIRRGEPCDLACERCGFEGRLPGYRYCRLCCRQVIEGLPR